MKDSTTLTQPRLDIRNLTRRYGAKTVVNDVSFRLGAGQVMCLLGPSGCGKSTTLRMIAGVEDQHSGEIYVDGQMICGPDRHLPAEQRGIGLMFQDFALFPHMSVAENVAFGMKCDKSEKYQRVKDLLSSLNMVRFIDSYPHELSGGEQQRVALARALAPKPQIMLMDEPFSGLDDRLRDDIRDETLDILKSTGTSVLLVTHEPHEALRMADEIAMMRAGRIVQMGSPYNLYHAPVDRQAMAFFSDINVIRSKVNGALAQTPFGDFLTPGQADGSAVDIVIRPQHIKIEFDRNGVGPDPTPANGVAARGRVMRSRFMGDVSLVEFRMEHDGSVLKATVPNVFLPKPDMALWLMIRRDRCFVFPATD